MILVPPLKPGDTIGIMAPSSRIAPEDIEAGVALLKARGFKTFVHPQCLLGNRQLDDGRFTQWAGPDQAKIDGLHDLTRDLEIDAVFFATGGQGVLKIVDQLDYDLIAANPKIYLGFSDITALLNIITTRTGLVTYHGPTLKRLLTNNQVDLNFRLLSGLEKTISLGNVHTLRGGKATGTLFGGNLSLITAMRDDDLPGLDGGILFIEDIKEELSTVERNLIALRRRGLFDKISGLIFGQFTNMMDTGTPIGATLNDIIVEQVAGLDIPIVTGAAFGHGNDLPILPIGQIVRLEGNLLRL